MRLATPFDPIDAGETDNFTFDFTADVGGATIVSTNWTCTLAQGQIGYDPDPRAHILSALPQTMLQIRNPIDGSLFIRTGAFSTAQIGGFPASAMGNWYVLEATANLSDGRILKLKSTVLCTPTDP